jgi:hypothetical protein
MSKCKCDLRTKLVGDGCRYCNPQEYIDKLIESVEEQIDWIKLTNDEIENCWKTAMKLDNGKGADITNQPFFHLARIVEYMLEEKNHG